MEAINRVSSLKQPIPMAAHASIQFYNTTGRNPNGQRPPHRAQSHGYNKNNSFNKDDRTIDVFLRPQNKQRQNQRPPTYRYPPGQQKPAYNKRAHDGDIIMRDSSSSQPQYQKRHNNQHNLPQRPMRQQNTHPSNRHGQQKPRQQPPINRDVDMVDVLWVSFYGRCFMGGALWASLYGWRLMIDDFY
ncbi:hypothetical protein BO78DRAFT_214214 [Aspergillus sclerotiicarbonarius CBS 121057]|uniref:Uncharacterized protein n=1 Tax=Aspergillus sclerotiicarbonarius (strain CBS 121057 / IBT 28362) TaxID=1448318 RepID=A0A319DYJ9_ASPSB|nr:hypothetical protein BO78DRAFT_214214 [Aspergillus sclerotiicarbonarius CBS 121057]